MGAWIYVKSPVFLAVLLLAVLVSMSGCATSGSGHRGMDGPDEVQGNVPTDADAFYPPPQGPEVLSGGGGGNDGGGQVEEGVAGEDSGVILRAGLDRLIARGPGYVFSQIETKAVQEGQKFVGFELISMSSVAQAAVGSAVQVGDVVTHINGVQQRLPDDYLRAWKMLGDAKTVRIDLIRDGEARHVSWRVE